MLLYAVNCVYSFILGRENMILLLVLHSNLHFRHSKNVGPFSAWSPIRFGNLLSLSFVPRPQYPSNFTSDRKLKPSCKHGVREENKGTERVAEISHPPSNVEDSLDMNRAATGHFISPFTPIFFTFYNCVSHKKNFSNNASNKKEFSCNVWCSSICHKHLSYKCESKDWG